MLSTISEAVLRMVSHFRREEGQALSEYGLILALVAVVCIAVLTLLGTALTGILGEIVTALGG